MERGDGKWLWILCFMFLLVIFLLSFTSAATRSCWSCGNCTAEISFALAGDVVQLNQSVSFPGGDCVSFSGKDNITFDCQSYSNFIEGAVYGIFLNDSGTNKAINNTIRNCNITASFYGIFLNYSNGNNLTNIITSSNTQGGIYLYSSNNNVLRNIQSSNNSYSGIFFRNSSYNNNTNLIINGNYEGLWFYGNSGNNILRNITTNENQVGIDISEGSESNNNELINVTSNNNLMNGLLIKNGSNNLFTNVVVQENGESDIYFSFLKCDQNFTNITGSGGRAIEYYNYTTTIQNKELAGLILCNANNSIINNVTIRGSDTLQNNFFGLSKTSNVSVSNLNSSGNYYGILLYESSNDTLINVTTNNNRWSGIYVLSSFSNTLTNIIGSYNSYGVFFLNSNNSILTNITVNSNSYYGIRLASSSYNNTIKNSFIQYSNLSGLFFAISQYNLFYNNYFNNSAQYSNTTGNLTNFFNTTKTAGTNIVGGSYIGGNYWASPNGMGFSQTCASSTDGICDTAYSLDGLNYDYLPLTCTENWSCSTTWSACSGNIQTKICIDANLCQTYKYKPIEAQQSCTSGGGGSSTTTSTTTVGTITQGEPTTVTITNPNIEVSSVTISTTENVSSVSITVTEVPRARVADFEIGISTRVIYQALNISVSGLNNNQIANATVNFRVNISWVEYQRTATEEDVLLFRRNEVTRRWEALNTTYLYNDSQFYYYTAITPGFSTFLIYFGKYECNPGDRRCYNRESQLCLGNATWLITEKCGYNCNEKGECIENPFPLTKVIYIGVIIGVVAAMIVTFYLVIKKISRKGKSKTSRKTLSRFYYNQSLHKSK